MFNQMFCDVISTTFLLMVVLAYQCNTLADLQATNPCCVETSSLDYFICEGLCEFPPFSPDAVEVSVEGGVFDAILSDHFPDSVQTIIIRNCAISNISSGAFKQLGNLVHVEFYNTTLNTIEGNAFKDLVFKSPPTAIQTDVVLSLMFNHCVIRVLDKDAFNNIGGVELLQFSDTVISSAHKSTFKNIDMQDGLIELTDVTVLDDDDFLNLAFITSVTETRIEGLIQNKLSSSLLNWSGQQHTLFNSSFVDIDEDLSERSYDEDGLSWSQVDIYCGEDIEWLMEDRSSIPEEMLNSLYCNGPLHLVGQMVSELDEDEWRDEVFSVDSDDSVSTLVISIIIVCVIVVILLVLGLVLYCKKQQKKNESDRAPIIRSGVAIVSSEKN